LTTDVAALGLVTTRFGDVTVRHRAVASSTRGTLFLHGAAGSWTTWTPLLALHHFDDPVLFDLPGWGDSELTSDTSIALIAARVREIVLELGYTEWDIVGHSMGGFLALHLATLWPSSVTSARLISGTAGSVVDAVRHPWRGLRTIPSFVAFRGAMIVLAAVDRPTRAVVRTLARVHLLRPFVAPLFRHPTRIDRSVVGALGRELRPRSFVAATAAVRNYDTARWDSITCPIYSTKGDHDAFVRDGDLVGVATVIPDCGHFGTVERPIEVLAALGYR
jgi:pimeloyl-ACP methyl ester carboxylesterase